MPAFKLLDHWGFSIDVQAGPGALSRYFKSLPDWAALAINLKQLKDTTWDSPSVIGTETLVSFTTPLKVGAHAVALNVDAGTNGRLSIFVPDTDNAPLFSPDVFGDNIPVRLDERYVSASLQASIETTLGAPIDKLQFGFDGKSGVNLTYCQLFKLNPVTPPVLESIAQTVGNFAIPGDQGDIAKMPEGSVTTAESSGTLKFTGDMNLLTFVNPLASVNMPIGNDLKVTGGGSIKVGAGFEFSGSYQVRVLRLAGSKFHLGFYRRREQGFSITAKASAGITTSLDQNTLFKTLLETISAQPQVDQNELATAGLPQGTINAIQYALESAIDRTLSLGMSMELYDSSERDAMFLFEVDLNALTPEGTTWLVSALQGNLGDVANRSDAQSIGIRILKTLTSSAKTLKHTFKVNLLGIYSAVTISSLVRTGKVAWDATTGDFVMTDSVNASRIGISAVNFGADTDKLRSVLAESLLITAAYKAGTCVAGQPELHACHTFFATSARSHRDQMWRDLSIGAGLGFIDAENAMAKLPDHVSEFGRTTVLAETSYDDDAFAALFFANGRQRTVSEYDRAGRNALRYLTRPEDPDGFRLRLIPDDPGGSRGRDALWAKMREIGNVQSGEFRSMFRDLPPAAVTVIGVDYINIVWWTEAMLATGRKLNAIRQLLSVPAVARTDPRFLKLKHDLADQLAKLAGRTRQDFGGPWGLLAMNLVAGHTGRRFLMFNPSVSLMCESPLPVLAAVG
jgi:hypothetical protein